MQISFISEFCWGPELISSGFTALFFTTSLEIPGLFLGLKGEREKFQPLSASFCVCFLVFPSTPVGRNPIPAKYGCSDTEGLSWVGECWSLGFLKKKY